jgi:phosphoribosylformylglycinamidine synthase
MVRVGLLFAAGTNCDLEMAQAFELAGAKVAYLHINEAKAKPERLRRFAILGIPGGFTYGDYIAAGRVLANELRFSLRDEIARFIDEGKLILGVCNGFQVLVKAGILPGLDGYFSDQSVTLEYNDSHRFECRWVYLQPAANKCVFTTGINRVLAMPVAHAEGKFVAKSRSVLKQVISEGLAVVRYVEPESEVQEFKSSRVQEFKSSSVKRQASCVAYPWNPNGSQHDIAGICDPTGRVFGLMPHPERFVRWTQHPQWTRKKGGQLAPFPQRKTGSCPLFFQEEPDGLLIYQNAVRYARTNL